MSGLSRAIGPVIPRTITFQTTTGILTGTTVSIAGPSVPSVGSENSEVWKIIGVSATSNDDPMTVLIGLMNPDADTFIPLMTEGTEALDTVTGLNFSEFLSGDLLIDCNCRLYAEIGAVLEPTASVDVTVAYQIVQ